MGDERAVDGEAAWGGRGMGRVEGQSATQNPNYNSTGWIADMTPAQRDDLKAFLKSLEAPVRPEALPPAG